MAHSSQGFHASAPLRGCSWLFSPPRRVFTARKQRARTVREGGAAQVCAPLPLTARGRCSDQQLPGQRLLSNSREKPPALGPPRQPGTEQVPALLAKSCSHVPGADGLSRLSSPKSTADLGQPFTPAQLSRNPQGRGGKLARRQLALQLGPGGGDRPQWAR